MTRQDIRVKEHCCVNTTRVREFAKIMPTLFQPTLVFLHEPPDAACVVLFLLKSYNASEINSRTCAWHDPGAGRQVAARRAARSMQVNATRPDAQRLQSATCRKQPGARHCRWAAGGRCVTTCSFFSSYFRSSFSPPSLSRATTGPVRTEPRRSVRLARDSHETDTYSRLSNRVYCAANNINIACKICTICTHERISPRVSKVITSNCSEHTKAAINRYNEYSRRFDVKRSRKCYSEIKLVDFGMEYSSRNDKKKRQRFLLREYSATYIKRRRGSAPFSLAEVYQAIDGKVAAATHFLLLPFPFSSLRANDGRSTLSRCPPPSLLLGGQYR